MDALFVSVRVLHVLLGAAWLGAAVMLSFFVMPAIQSVGPDGGKVVAALMRRRLDAFIASISGLVVLSGLYLYWVITNGFSAGASSTMKARVLGAGAVLGVAAAIVGGSVVARNMKKAVALMTQAAAADGSTRSALMAQATQCRQKAGTGGRTVAFLLIVTAILMVVGAHFA